MNNTFDRNGRKIGLSGYGGYESGRVHTVIWGLFYNRENADAEQERLAQIDLERLPGVHRYRIRDGGTHEPSQ